MFSSVIDFYINSLAGIKMIEPGFKHIEINPYFAENMKHMTYKLDTVLGKLSISWKKDGDTIKLQIKNPKEMKITLGKAVLENKKIEIIH